MKNPKNPVSAVKERHRQKAFELLLRKQEISRVEIARELAVSLQTAMKIMQYFTDYGLAEYIGERDTSQVGRRPQMYAFNPEVAHIVSVVHEGSFISVGIINLAGEIRAEETVEMRGGIHELLVEQPCEVAERLIAGMAEKGQPIKRLLGIGLCLPGVVDDERNEISFAPSFPTHASYQIDGLLAETADRMKVPVCIENDVNAAVYGEFTHIGIADMVFITIGTGVGMGLVLDGKLRRGPSFTAGEIGLMPYPKANMPPQLKSVEELIGLDALKKRFGFDWRFGTAEMAPEGRKKMVEAVSDVIAYIIATCAAILNVSDFILGGLTAQLLGKELFDEISRKAGRLSPFTVTLRKQKSTYPELIGGARKVLDRQLENLLTLDSIEAGRSEEVPASSTEEEVDGEKDCEAVIT